MDPGQDSVFISFSHEDEAWKERVVRHLRVLEGQGQLDVWDDRRIAAGEDWRSAIESALSSARVALLLVSADSLTSRFILDAEVPALLRRRTTHGMRLLPLILRPCAWQAVDWLAAIQVVPRDGRALATLSDHEVESALAELARDIHFSLAESAPDSLSGSPASVPAIVPASPPVDPAPTPAGDPMNDYEIVKLVAEGNYGRAFKCRRRDSDALCVVKSTEARHVSRAAIESLAELRCPNVAAARRIWEHSDRIYEELPYVGGIRLQDIVTPGVGGLDGALLESFHEQLDGVLATLHRASLVHRDIHPSNIYMVIRRLEEVEQLAAEDVERGWTFDAFGWRDAAFLIAWVVVDCTFAIHANDMRQVPYRHGPFTPEEQQAGSAAEASDMYAFGATMYYGITGKEPPSAGRRRTDPRAEVVVPKVMHPSFEFKHYLQRLLSLDAGARDPAEAHLRQSTIADEYVSMLEVDESRYLVVHTFPMSCRLVESAEALRLQRANLRSSCGRDAEYWVRHLSG